MLAAPVSRSAAAAAAVTSLSTLSSAAFQTDQERCHAASTMCLVGGTQASRQSMTHSLTHPARVAHDQFAAAAPLSDAERIQLLW